MLIRWHKIRNSKIRNALLSDVVGIRNRRLGKRQVNKNHEDPSGRGMPDPDSSIIEYLFFSPFHKKCLNI